MMDYSQCGEQELLRCYFASHDITKGVSLEFGAPLIHSNSNTAWCREAGWESQFWDMKPLDERVRQATITPENINMLLNFAGLYGRLDLLSIDIDSFDYWVWRALKDRPRIICIEFNQNLPVTASITIPQAAPRPHDGTDYYGASFQAMLRLARAKKYHPLYATALNLIFVRHEDFDCDCAVAYTQHSDLPHGEGPWVEVGEDGEPRP